MTKAYTRIVWENYPSTGTPLNESNLNRMDSALDIIDDRVLSMDTTKLDKNTAYTMVKSITFNEDTGIFTITYLNGSTSTLDTKLEKLAVNFGFDAESEKLTITLEDGTVQEVDLSDLISKYNFEDSATIGFTVGNDGNVVAIVKEGSIEGKHLEPNYLANVTAQAENASASASNAAISEMNAAASAEAAEAAAERAESVSSVSIATTEKPGIVKPDGSTIAVGADGSISVGEAVTNKINSVKDDLENLTAEDVGARPSTWMPTASEVGAVMWKDEAVSSGSIYDWVYAQSVSRNAKINKGSGVTDTPSDGYWTVDLKIYQNQGDEKKWAVLDVTSITGGEVYRNVLNWGAWTGWFPVHSAKTITKGTTALTANSSSLATDCIYLQYE